MDPVITLCLATSALIHLLPLSGVLGAARLAALYGAEITDPTVLLAMRHRAVLFGVLGGLLIWAIFVPALRVPIMAGTAVADAAFAVLALRIKGTHPAMRKVLVADGISLVALAGAGAVMLGTP